jgi:hypothetical protein
MLFPWVKSYADTSQEGEEKIEDEKRKICDLSIVSVAFITFMTIEKKGRQSSLQYIRVLYLNGETKKCSFQICDKCVKLSPVSSSLKF